jgi:isoleucyl-tRNA synthetase
VTKGSIHLELFPEIPEIWSNDDVMTRWNLIREIRKTITELLEIERAAKTIGSSLEADVLIYSNDLEKIKIISDVDFDEIAIVSKTSIVNAQPPSNATFSEDASIGVVIEKALGTKCDRCWKISKEVVLHETQYGTVNLCPRCFDVVIDQ